MNRGQVDHIQGNTELITAIDLPGGGVSVNGDKAKEYARAGLPVFPLIQSSKKPLTPRGFKDATTDQAQIDAWWTQYPNANIGMPTGKASGLYVVDIDGPEGEATLADLIAQHGPIPQTLTSKTGRGTHYFFKTDEPIRNTAGALGKGIDTRGEGGYVVLPPSKHPGGSLYEWANDDLNETRFLPDWLRPDSPKGVQASQAGHALDGPRSDSLVGGARPQALSHDHDETLRRASAYLAAMPPAIQGAGGHNALFAAACAMVHGFDLSHLDAYNLLANEYNPRCAPPWNLAERADHKDFQRKINQAETTSHDRPRGYLVADDGFSQGDVEHGAMMAAGILASAETKKATQATQTGEESYTASNTPTLSPGQPKAQSGFPAHLLKPPGVLGELAAWMDQGGIRKQPVLSLAASITFAGVLFGRKIQTHTGLRTNIYALGVAKSGAGKDHARKCIKNLCQDAGPKALALLGGEGVTSEAAITAALTSSLSCLFLFDEIGHMIAGAKNRNASTYQAAIPVMFTKLFTSANTTHLGTQYAASSDQKRQDLVHPNACIYGTTVPRTLWASLSSSEIDDGMIGRFLVFQTADKMPEESDPILVAPPANLIEWVQAWIEYGPGQGNLKEALSGSNEFAPTPDVYQQSVRAKLLLREFKSHCDQERERIEKDPGLVGLEVLWTRAAEHAQKLALIHAASQMPEPAPGGREIEEDSMRWACDLTKHLVGQLVDTLALSVSDSKAEGDRKYVMQRLKANDGRMTRRDLSRACQRLKGRDFDDVMRELEDMERIAVTTEDRGKKLIEVLD